MAARAPVSYTLCASACPWRVRKVCDRLGYPPYSVARLPAVSLNLLFSYSVSGHAMKGLHGESHLQALSEMLKVNKTIAILDLQANLVGSKGAEALGGEGDDSNTGVIKSTLLFWSLAFWRPLLKRSSGIIASKNCTLMAMKLATMQ